MSLRNYVIGCLRDRKLSKHDTLKNAIIKIKTGAIADSGSEYAAKKNGLWDVTVEEAVRGMDNMELQEQTARLYAPELYDYESEVSDDELHE